MMKFKIKKGDKVKVLSGKDRNKTGKVLSVHPAISKAVVEGVNLHTRFVKTRGQGKPGGQMTSPSPLHISKLQLVDPANDKPTRVGFRVEGDIKQRISKKSGQPV